MRVTMSATLWDGIRVIKTVDSSTIASGAPGSVASASSAREPDLGPAADRRTASSIASFSMRELRMMFQELLAAVLRDSIPRAATSCQAAP
jgi:hypothetical protein